MELKVRLESYRASYAGETATTRVRQMNEYPFTSIVTFVLFLSWVLASRVSLARATYANKQQNPEMAEMYSDTELMIAFRNHQNLLEQLVVMLPTLWNCATGVSDLVASILGSFYFVGTTYARNSVISAIDQDYYYLFFHFQR